MKTIGAFCFILGAAQLGLLGWHYQHDLNALLNNYSLWGTMILSSLLVIAGAGFLFKPNIVFVKLFAVVCAFYVLGIFSQVLALYQAELFKAMGYKMQIASMIGSILVLRISYGLVNRIMTKRLAAQKREHTFLVENNLTQKD